MGNTTDCLEDMYFSATVDIHRANLFIEVQLPNVRHVSVPIPPVHRSRISTLSSGFTFISSPRFLFPTVVFSAVRVEICWLKKEKKRRRRRDG